MYNSSPELFCGAFHHLFLELDIIHNDMNDKCQFEGFLAHQMVFHHRICNLVLMLQGPDIEPIYCITLLNLCT